MAIQRFTPSISRLNTAELAEWAEIPVAVAGDALNRMNVMQSRLRAVTSAKSFTGQAFTVDAFHGDNAAIHVALKSVQAGDVLVINGGGLEDRALWGGILNHLAKRQGVLGVIVDGAVRDVEELEDHGLPVRAAGVSPAGPSKGWGGAINSPVSCGGVVVHPGDLIHGDADGVVVIPQSRIADTLKTAQSRLAAEQDILARLDQGEFTADIFGINDIEDL